MKAITIHQPYALAIVAGIKKYETRSCHTNIRGVVAIHASKKDPYLTMCSLPGDISRGIYQAFYAHFGIQGGAIEKMKTGAVIGTVEIVDCVEVEQVIPTLTEQEKLLGDYSPGRFAWILRNPVVFAEPVPAKGHQGWWNWDGDKTIKEL